MRLRITAKRWDEPLEVEAHSIVIRHVLGNYVEVVIDDKKPQRFELHPEIGERLEVIA